MEHKYHLQMLHCTWTVDPYVAWPYYSNDTDIWPFKVEPTVNYQIKHFDCLSFETATQIVDRKRLLLHLNHSHTIPVLVNVTPRQYLFQYLQQRITISARFYVFRVRNLFTNTISLVSLATFGALLIKEYLHLRPFCFFLSVWKETHSTASVLVWRRQWSKNTTHGLLVPAAVLSFIVYSYFGRENETMSSNSLQRLVGIFSPYWSIDWVGCSVPPWSYDNFLPAKNKFPRILRNKFGV